MINTEINRLLNFAKQQNLMVQSDEYYAANKLIDLLGAGEYALMASLCLKSENFFTERGR